MQDRTPLYPGRVKLVPVEGHTNVYDMTREDSPTQPGTPLSKATLLKDATAALYGLGTDAVPDDVLSLLSRFHNGLGSEYLWAKYQETDTLEPLVYEQKTLAWNSTTPFSRTITYSDSYELDSDHNVILAEPKSTISISNTSYASAASALAGKYYTTPDKSGVYLAAESITVSYTLVNTNPTILISSAAEVTNVHATTFVGYVNSPNENAYPPAVSDGYTYTALGQIGNKVRIATGSYTGTGTHGSNNPNSLTFDFEPKIVFITNGDRYTVSHGNASYTSGSIVSLWPTSYTIYCGFGETGGTYGKKSSDGKTLTWYNTYSDAKSQWNTSGLVYRYIAIG